MHECLRLVQNARDTNKALMSYHARLVITLNVDKIELGI